MFFQLLLALLIPLAIYCLILAMINRRPKPVMVHGAWDCVGLIFAASGFLLIVGPVVIGSFYVKYGEGIAKDPALVRDKVDVKEVLAHVLTQWWGVFVLYYVMVVLLVAALLWWRRNKTVIYNVDTERFYHLLARILGQLGYGNRPPPAPLMQPLADAEGVIDLAQIPDGAALRGLAAQRVPIQDLLEVEIFAPLSNITLHWRTNDPNIRGQIEEELHKQLHEACLVDNPAATWLMGVAGMLLTLTFLVAIAIILNAIFGRR